MTKQQIIDYLRRSLNLDKSSVTSDPAYTFSDENLWDILAVVTPTHNPTYTIETIPQNELQFVILLARREVYYRLASASAPFYPLEAEGASLRKDYRFEHYYKLIGLVTSQYESSWADFDSKANHVVKSYDVLLMSKHMTARNYRLSNAPDIELEVAKVESDWVGIKWTKPTTGVFSHYEVYLSESPILDDFTEEIDPTAKRILTEYDIHKTKLKVTELKPSTSYYFLVISHDTNGLSGATEVEVTTEDEPLDGRK